MKKLFKGYIKKSEAELKDIWNKAIFVFDTNVLLNLYRYSDDTRNSILDLIKNFKDRIFLPHHAAYEFNKNRYLVISQHEKIFNDFYKKVQDIETEINSKTKHPFLSEDLNKEINKVFKKIEKEVSINKRKFQNLSNNDNIFDSISDLFENRITKEYSNTEILEIEKEGKVRYEHKIPPGFEDNNKSENKYGDLILWKQIIEISKEKNSDIILISDDEKKDWYWILESNKNKIGPHPKLIEEFYKETGFNFHIFTSERFLDLGSKYSDITPSKEAINEIEAIKKEYNDVVDKKNIFRKFSIIETKINNILTSEESYQLNKIKEHRNIEQATLSNINEEIERMTYLFYDKKLKSGLKKEIADQLDVLESYRIETVEKIKNLIAQEHHLVKKINSKKND